MSKTLISKDHSEIILDSITEGVFTVDADWNITTFNQAAEKITGFHKDEALGRKCFEIFRTDICEMGCILRKTMASGENILNQNVNIISSGGETIPISVNTALLKSRSGDIVGGVETFKDCREVELLKKQISRSYTCHDIMGRSQKIHDLLTVLPDIAESSSIVLILGPSGSGKEIFARAIHSLSNHNKGPFIPINCGAIPDNLLESELFGHVKGAFTDAKSDKPGKFKLAENGTLFLDEIGDLPQLLQVKLLRVIQEKEFEPIGATKHQKSTARLLFATNRDLARLVSEGKFREDLYYRINVIKLTLPSLAQRREDIPLLLSHFINIQNHISGKQIKNVSTDVMNFLMHYDFPGNIRELQNIIEYAFVFCRGNTIELHHLPQEAPSDGAEQNKLASTPPEIGKMSLAQAETDVIMRTLEKHKWRRKEAADELGMDTSTLWRKMKKYQIL